MTARRHSLRLRLALGTALAGGTLVVALPAAAQTPAQLPQGGQVIIPVTGTVVVDGTSGPVTAITPAAGATSLDIGLNQQATVINWNSFNVVGGTDVDGNVVRADVNFRQASGLAANAVVVNRVIAGGGSRIANGSVTTYGTAGNAATGQNTMVYLLNPAGVLVGGGGAVDAGGFLASTLDICGQADCTDALGNENRLRVQGLDPLEASLHLQVPASAAAAAKVRVEGSGTITTTGALVLVAGTVEVTPTASQTSLTLSAGGDVNLVAATDVRVQAPRSPLVYQIDAGSQIAGALISTGGRITGTNVLVAAARPASVTESLLSIGGAIQATGVGAGDRGIVLLGGTGATAPAAISPDDPAPEGVIGITSTQTGAIGITSTASLTAARDVLVNATGRVGIGGSSAVAGNYDVTAGRDYRVAGSEVTLGPVTLPPAVPIALAHRAGRAVTVRSTAGDIRGLEQFTLQSDSGGLTGGAVTLSSAGAIRFGADTTILGGTTTSRADIRISEGTGATATGFGTITGRSLGAIPTAAGQTAPLALTLYGATTLGVVSLDRALDLRVATAGAATGSLIATSITTGVTAVDDGTGTATADALSITTAGTARFGSVASRTGSVTVTARDGDVTGLVVGGVTGAADVTAAVARTADAGAGVLAVTDGNVAVYAGRSSAGALTATGTNGLALLGAVTAGNDVTVRAQKIDAVSVRAAAVSDAPVTPAGAASGTALLRAYAHDATAGAIDLRVGSASAGTGSATRAGLDVLLTADAASATLVATTLNADRNVTIVAGSGADGAAGVVGEVRAGRLDGAGAYGLTAGAVSLGVTGATVQQSAAGAVGIRATATDITGSGTLTLQSGSDGAGNEALTLDATRAIAFGADTRLFAGNGTAAGNADLLVAEGSTATATTFGQIRARSLGGIPVAPATAPVALTLYGPTTLGTVDLDRSLTLRIANGGGGAVGTLTTGAVTVGVNAVDGGSGIATADSLTLTTAGSARLLSGASRTGSLTITATDGDVTGLSNGAGFDRVDLSAAVASAGTAPAPAIADGNLAVYAGRTSAGALTATGTNGLALLGTVSAGNDVTVRAQKIDATSVQAAAASATPVTPAGAASGTALLHAYAHDTTAGAVDLRVGSASAGTGTTARAGLDVSLIADAASAVLAATTLNADRNVSVATGSGADGLATVSGEVRAGRVVGAGTGGYAVAAGAVTLGTAATAIQQSAAGAVTILSTLAGITGLGTLTLQSNSDGTGNEALTLDAARAIAFGSATRLFAGNGAATGNSDLVVAEGGTATATSFGQVRARRLRSALGGATVTLYGPTTFGTVDLDRSLTLQIANGGGGAPGTLTTGAVTLGVNPVDGGAGTATADNLVLTTASNARFLSVTSRTGSLSITATDGDVTGLSNGAGFDRLNLSAAVASTAVTPAIANGNIGVYAGRTGAGALTATGSNGLALLGTVTAGNDVTVLAQKIDAATVQAGAVSASPVTPAGAASGSALLHAYAHDTTVGAVDLRVGSASAGTGTAARPGLDVSLIADAADATLAATTLNADRTIAVVAGSGVNGAATVSGEVRAGRIDGTGAYGVTAGAVTLGTAATAIQQSATGAVAIRSTATDIAGLGTLTLQSNSNGTGNESLTLIAARAIAFGAGTRLFAGNGTAAGNSDLLVAEGGTATATSFGQVRARQLRSALGAGTVTLYGPTSFGTVELDRSLTLQIANGPGGEPGTLTTGAVTLGVNPVDGGAGIATADNLVLTTASNARLLSVTSRTGSLSITATDGDVTGLSNGAGFDRVNLSAAVASTGVIPALADGNVGVFAGRAGNGVLTATGANGLALLGTVTAGNDVTVLAQKIDAATVQAAAVSASPVTPAGAASGSVLLQAFAHDATAGAVDLRVGSASAGTGSNARQGVNVQLIANVADATLVAATLNADRNVTALAGTGANGSAAITGEVRANRINDVGGYGVTAGLVTLGNGTTAVEQSSRGAVSIRSTATDIIGSQRLTLRSNSAGVVDGTGDAAGTRTLTLDAARTIDIALPDGLTVAARDAVAGRLIGGSDAAPRQSAVFVRAGSGTTLTLGNVSARSLRSLGATPVAAGYPDFAARAGAQPLYHDSTLRIGSVDTAESLGIFAYTGGGGGNVVLQIDSARSRTGNVELVASGELRGYQLTAPGGGTPLGVYVATDITSDIARVDTYSRSALLDDVSAGGYAGLETFGGRLRVDTVVTGTSLPLADSGIGLTASTDLRLTSAVAARGNVAAQATAGSVTGLPTPDDGTATTNYAAVTRMEASDGNLAVRANGTTADAGLIAASTLVAGSSETPGAAAPARGNLLASGQRVGIGTATAGLGSLTLQAQPNGATPVATGIVLGAGSAGTTASVTVAAGSLVAPGDANGSAVIGTLTAGTNARTGGATALAGNVGIGAAANVRAGTIESRTGGVTVYTPTGDVTGLLSGGVYGRANLTAATAQAAAGSSLAIADGTINVYAGRSSTGVLTTSGANGLALLGTATAGGNVTILAQAIDATRVQSINGSLLARAYAADGAVTGGGTQALVLGEGLAGLGITLESPAGSVAAGTVTAGQRRTGTAGDVAVTTLGSARLGTVQATTGSVTVTARNGDVTGLSDGAGGFGRATLTGAFATPAAGTDAAIVDGNVAVYAGRDAAGALTAAGTNGLARLAAVTAGGNVTVRAQAIDGTRADAARGTVTATAYAADGAIPRSAGEALVLGEAGSGLGSTLTATTGSVRTTSVTAGRLAGSVGNAVIDAALDVRAGTVTSQTGAVTATARDGDLTGLLAGGAYGRADATASAATGDVNLYAGRTAAGVQTATGTNGLALLGTVTAGRNVTVLAQAIDATRAEATAGAIFGRAYAADAAIPGSAAEALAVGTALSGLGTTLETPVGSIRAGTVTAGRQTGSLADAVLDAALNIRAGVVTSQTRNVTATARDGDITGLATGGRADFTASAATGDVGLYAGRDTAGALTASGSAGLAQLGAVTAGRSVTVRAQAIDATRVEATNGTLTAVAYAADGAVAGSGTEALILGDGLSGLGTSLSAPAGSVRVGTVAAGRLGGATRDAVVEAARNIRAGTVQSLTGNVTATARQGDITGLATGGVFGRANVTASAATGDVGLYAGRDSTGVLTAAGSAGLARLGNVTAGRNATVLAQAIDAPRIEATGGTILSRAYAADAAVTGSAAESLTVGEALSGLGTTLNTTAGSIRATIVTAGRQTGSLADAILDAALNIRAGTITSQTRNVTATARNGDLTGLTAGTGADVFASAATGDIGLYAGRDAAGALTATGTAGLARLGTVTAGRAVTIRAQAIDATRVEATDAAFLARAYAADGAVPGSGTEALILREGLSGLATTLTASAGSVRVDAATAGRLTGSVADATVEAQRSIRAGMVRSLTGNVAATAREADITGLSTAGVFGRATFLADAAAGNVGVYAGRDAAGGLTAVGNAGLARIDTARGGGTVTILAQAIDATRLEATNGAVAAQAYAADGAVTGSAAEALVVGEAFSGLTTTLTASVGSVRATAITAGRLTGGVGNVLIDSARNVRLGLAQTATGRIGVTARDGDLTGLLAAGAFGRATLSATAATGDIALNVGRTAAGAQTATGIAGLALIDSATAGRNLTIRVQAIDALRLETTNGAILAQAYAPDATIAGRTGEALIVTQALSGLATALTASAGSVRTDGVTAGRLSGVTGDAVIDAARNVRTGATVSETGRILATARDGDITGLATATGFGRAQFTAQAATGDIALHAGRDAAGTLTATGSAGLVLAGTATAGRAITVGAQAVDVTRAEAIAGALTARAFAADGAVPGSGGEALVIGEGLSGLTTALSTTTGSIRATTLTAGTLAGGVGDLSIDSALNVRVGTALSQTGSIGAIARGGDLTGLDTGSGFGRAILTASAATGDVAAYAGRDAAGVLTAVGTAGLALIDTVTAGRNVTLGAQAIDVTRAQATSGVLVARAYAIDGAVTGSAGDALVLAEGLSGLSTTLATSAGSVRATTLTAGTLAGGTGNLSIDAARNVRLGTAESLTGSIGAVARDGDVTGLANATGYDRTLLTASGANGDIVVYAGRDATGALTATGSAGLALIDTATAVRDVTIGAQAIDARRLEATGGALSAQAYAADFAVPGSGGEALVVVDTVSGLATSLTTAAGSVRAATVTAGTLAGDVAIDSALDVRIGTALSQTGDVLAIARGGDLTGLHTGSGYGRAILTAAAASGNVGAYAGRDPGGTPTAIGDAGLAFIDTVTAGNAVTIGAQAIDVTRAEATSGTLAAQAYAADGAVAGSASDALVLAEGLSGLGTTLTTSAGSVRAINVTSGTLAGSVGDLAIDSALNVRVGTALSRTGSVGAIARGGDLTGLDTGSGFGRAILTASAATGDVAAYAGRDAAGVLTAAGSAGLALIDTVTAGRNVTLGAQAMDVTQAQAINSALTAQAYAVDGAVTGSAGDALVLAEGLSGLSTTLVTSAGSVRATTLAAGTLAGGTGNLSIDAARNVRLGTAESLTGSIGAVARDGDVTGLVTAAGAGRAVLTANAAAGDIGIYAGRDVDGGLTATAGDGLALVDTVTAGRAITVKAQAIDANRLGAGTAILGQAWAADGAAPATGGEALVVVDAASGTGTTLTSFGGSIRSRLVDAGLAGAAGDIAIDAARDVRIGTARTTPGSVAVVARDGAITGLANATGFDRTILTAGVDLGVFAGRDAAGAQTATGGNGLAFIDTATAGRDLTLGAQAIDATTLTAGRSLAARTFAADGTVTGSAPASLTLVTATAGQGAALTSAGSIRAATAAAGRLRTGVTGNLAIDAARNVTIDLGTSTTGNVTVTARDGAVVATTLAAAIGSTAQGTDAAIADGNVAVYAGRDAAGALTATGSNGLAQLGTVTAGNDVTVRAQTIAATTVQAAAVSATPLAAGAASGTATLVAYRHDATPGAVDLGIGTVSAGTGTGPRRGLDVVLASSAAGGTLNATTIAAGRNVIVSAGSGSDGAAAITGQVRAGRTDAAGAYAVTAGQVTLGTAGTAIEQSAPGAVAIVSTAADIVGLGTLTLQSNSDGAGREALTLRAARGIVLPAASRLFGGTDTAAGTSEILVFEGAGATLTTFGEVRGRSLGGIPTGTATAPVPLTLYGATTFGTVNLDRSLDLTVANGGGGAVGTLVTGPLLVGRYPASGVADSITIRTSGTARFASIRSATGGVSVTTTGAAQNIVSDAGIDAANAILLNAAGDVTTTTVTSSAGGVRIGAGGSATGQVVTASGGAIDVAAGARAQYTTLTARDAITVGAGSMGVGTATAGTALAMTANGADTGATDGEALVLGAGNAGTTAALAATTGSVRATTIDAGQARNGTLGNLVIAAARNVRVETGTSGTGSTTVTARDGTVAATTLRAAIASVAQGSASAVTDGNVSVYAGRDASGALTATGGNGLAQLGTVSAGNNVTVLAQKIAAGTVQAADGSATAAGTTTPSGTATLTAYAHDTATGAVDLSVGTVAAGTGTSARRGLDVVLAANATGGTLAATTINADRNVAVTAGNGTNGSALVSGAVRAGRVDPAGTYAVRGGTVTLGTAGQTVEQSAAAATSATATAGSVTGLGALTLQANRDGTGGEALDVRATGGSVVFDPTSTLRGGQASGTGSAVTIAATGNGAGIDIGTLGALGSTATLQADGSIVTRGPLTAGTAALTAGGTIATNGSVTAPTLTMQATGGITTNGAVAATTATLQSGAGITINGALSATTASLRAVGRATTTAPITATTLTVQSSQIALGGTVTGTTVGLYNQATAANATRLGGAASATDAAYDLDEAEFGRIAAGTLTIGSGADDTSGRPLDAAWLRQNVEIGKLAIASGTGTTAVKVVGTGSAQTITVNGAVTMNTGTARGTPVTRALQLGGAATGTAGEVGRVLIVNDGGTTGATGAIAVGGGVLDLRAGQILAGKQAFITEVLAAGAEVGRTFVSNPNSSLYGAGANGYLTTGTPVQLVTTGQLRVQFSNVALFQNTSRPGAIPTGVTITGPSSSAQDGQPLLLRSGSSTLANAFALFGKFEPSATQSFFSTQAALLGPTFISNGATGSNGVNPSGARLNGCLISSASGGCLASSIAQPTLNVFDVTRDQVLRGSDNLVVTFDPLVGSNNEALFGDIAAGDSFDLQRCPDGTVSAQCKQSGDAKQ